MIEKVAILIMTLVNQASYVSNGNVELDFLGSFVNEGYVEQDMIDFKNRNWNYYKENIQVGKALEIVPIKGLDVSSVEVSAKSSVVIDVGTNAILHSKDMKRKMPIASLTKIMTAIIALEKMDMNEKIVVSDNALKAAGKRDGLFSGEEIVAGDLIRIMLVNSNNIASEAIAEHVGGSTKDFVDLMNKKAKLLGLENTRFFNPSGLDGEEENYSNAFEVAQMFDYSQRYPEIWEILKIQKAQVWSADKKTKHFLKSTNRLLGKLSNIEGGKTGFTDDAGECLVLMIGDPKDGHKVIAVVLDSKDRFSDAEKMIKWIFDNYKW